MDKIKYFFGYCFFEFFSSFFPALFLTFFWYHAENNIEKRG